MQSEFHHKVYNIPIITFISPIKCQPVHNVKTVSASQDIIKNKNHMKLRKNRELNKLRLLQNNNNGIQQRHKKKKNLRLSWSIQAFCSKEHSTFYHSHL